MNLAANHVLILLQSDFPQSFVSYFQRLRREAIGLWGVAVELLLIGAIVYAALRFLQGTRGERLFKSFWLILFSSFLVVRLVAKELDLERVLFLYPYFVGGIALTALVAFQPEIRRGLIRLGEARWLESWAKETERMIDPIVTAVLHLSQKKIGALIAIQREVGIDAVSEEGVQLDAEISAPLLETIFWPGSALHDLGVVVRHGRIAAAACQFPIAETGEAALALGSRHRAAVGLSHECDAIIVVVSEENGMISVAQSGKLTRGLSGDGLRDLLAKGLYAAPEDKPEVAEEPVAEEIVEKVVVADHGTQETKKTPVAAKAKVEA